MENQIAYYPMHMHIHTCFQPGSSMAAHMYNAKKLGMRYIWFTDHDTRTGIKDRPVNGFSFDGDSLAKADHGFEVAAFEKKAAFAWTVADRTATLQAKADPGDQWQSAGISFMSTGTRHTVALLMQVALKLGLSVEGIGGDSRLVLDVRLSQRPPECECAHMLYVLGDPAGLAAPDCQVLPLNIENGVAVLPLSEDVSEEPAIGGKDNVFDTITVTLQVRSGSELTVRVKDFVIEVQKFFEQAHQAQKEVAARVGERYGVTPFVAYEASLTEHKNCFCSKVPTIDYAEHDFCVTDSFVAEHIKKHGGIFAINHPLAIKPLKRKNLDEAQRLQVIAKMAAALLANRAWGAELMEVGFPMGRNGFSMQEYLMLWDLLSAGGLFLCGYGSSDSHRNNDGWFDGNNFATWLGVDAALQHPIAEEAFILAMKQGNAYTGDPVKLQGAVRFETEDGFSQGTVFRAKEKVNICFRAQDTKPGWRFRLVENGREVCSEEITGEEFAHRSVLMPGLETVSFQRAEMYDETGRCILLTNPIYLVKEELAWEIPPHRLPGR